MSEQLLNSVKAKYGAVAASSLTNAHAGVQAIAEAFGYTEEELTSIPAAANMGLSCGNPIATAHLKPGEVVVDLGSGGGLDVFLAASKVGPQGRAIGIDMTQAMIQRAEANAQAGGYTNVEFHLATIDKLPLADASVDCVISNCVLNLAPDKPAVFREILRVLKPGGRLAISDIALKTELPEAIANSLAAYVGCIAGAILIETYREDLRSAGFEFVEIVDSGADLNAYAKVESQAGCCSPAMDASSLFNVVADACCTPAPTSVHEDLTSLLSTHDVNAAAASVKVYALKPNPTKTRQQSPRTFIFACVHNAGRSQMSAAFFNQLADPAKAHAISAGTQPAAHVHPVVVDAMREVGIDLSSAQPQKLTAELAEGAQMLVTMGCGDDCPYVPGLRREDWPLPDPRGQTLEAVRVVRDEIRTRIEALLNAEGLARAS